MEIRRLSGELFHQQSVTLTARMWPPAIEAGPTNTVWGLPTLVWGILIGCSILAVLALAALFLCCWLLPRSRKFLSPTRCTSLSARTTTTVSSTASTSNLNNNNNNNNYTSNSLNNINNDNENPIAATTDSSGQSVAFAGSGASGGRSSITLPFNLHTVNCLSFPVALMILKIAQFLFIGG